MIVWGLLGIALAQTHRIQFLETGTGLPVVVKVTCGDVTMESTPDGFLELDVICDTVYIQSPYHHSATYTAPDFLQLTTVPLRPLQRQETVVIEEQRNPVHARSYGLNTEDLERTPGGYDDPIRVDDTGSPHRARRDHRFDPFWR